MNRLRLLLLFLSLFGAFSVHARRKSDFNLDTSLRLVKPMPCKGFRMLPSGYDGAVTPWYGTGRSLGTTLLKGSDWPLSSQMHELLNKNCSSGELVSVALEDVKMYFWNVSSLYIHADFFIGEPGGLHHFYTLDTIVQKQSPFLPGGTSGRVAAECMLDAVRAVCAHPGDASATSFSDEDASNYYRSLQHQYPLYTQAAVPPMGIYRTVDDFMNLRPMDTPLVFEHIAQPSGDGYNWFYFKTADGGK
jgi:hypothetical protein